MSSIASEPRRAVPRLLARWPEWLVFAGAVALLAGLAIDGTWDGIPSLQRPAEAFVLGAAAMLVAWALRRWRGWPLADGLALVAALAVVALAGPLPVLAALLLASAALAVGRLVTTGGAALPVGMAVLAGATGWLLPLPVHAWWSHGLVLACLVAWRWRDVRDACGALFAAWREARDGSPWAACLAMLVLFVASSGTWVPTMQYDDLTYHVGIAYQLQYEGRYALDPTHQIWALAPWAGDVLQGIVQVVAGREARGALNAVWLALAAAGVHRLAGLLGASVAARWGAVAVFATLPMTQSLAANLQTELPAAAALLWLACVIADDDASRGRTARLLAGALLFGLLCGLKVMHAAVAMPLLAWAACRHRHAFAALLLSPRGLGTLALAALLAGLVGGSSYAYAWFVAGNPVLPLMNGTFQSPYFPPTDFFDERWRVGLDPLLFWDMTFDTERYFEGPDGAMGFVLVAAAGAWLLALLGRRTRGFALAATAALAIPLLPMQYARYAYPSIVLLLPVLVVALDRAVPTRRAALLVGALCALQLAFHGAGYWMLGNGAAARSVAALGIDAPLLEKFAPERLLIEQIRDTPADGLVLALGTNPDAFAELGARGRTASWYAPAFNERAWHASAQPDGGAWADLIRQEGIEHVIVRDGSLSDAHRDALARLGAVEVASVREATWWRIPPESP